MRITTFFMILSLITGQASASSVAGPGWRSLSFETEEGEAVKVVAAEFSVVLSLNLRDCAATTGEIPVGGLPSLRNVGFFHDEDHEGKYYLVQIPAIHVRGDLQTHLITTITLRNCKVYSVESEHT